MGVTASRISKHSADKKIPPESQRNLGISSLAVLNKFILTFRTSNANSSLAPGHSHFLLTGRAFIKMMCLPLPEMLFLTVPLYYQLIPPVEKLLVLCISALNLPGHHTVILVSHQTKSQNIENIQPGKHGNHQKHQRNPHQQPSILVCAISSHHKMLYLLLHIVISCAVCFPNGSAEKSGSQWGYFLLRIIYKEFSFLFYNFNLNFC